MTDVEDEVRRFVVHETTLERALLNQRRLESLTVEYGYRENGEHIRLLGDIRAEDAARLAERFEVFTRQVTDWEPLGS